MAGKKLNWSARAKRELKEIVRFYRQRNGNDEYGWKLLQEFRKATKRVEREELTGQRFEDTDLRFVVVLRTFQIFYRIGWKRNSVVAVWDARRNPDDLSFD
jgi:toxin YoeB